MLGEIFVALITTVGTVWVAFISLRAGSQRVSRRYNKPLMDLCALWGRTRGVAEAAVDSCVQALEERREEAASRTTLTATQRDELFCAETRPSPELYEALRGEFSMSRDGLLAEFGMYEDAVKQFRTELRRFGDRIDVMSSAPRLSEIGIDRYLPALESALQEFDAAFERCLSSYLQRKNGAFLSPERRRLRKQAEDRNKNFRHSGRSAFASQPESESESADGSGQGEGAPSGGAEPPPCGYCIWRCPHAPAQTPAPAPAPASAAPATADLTGVRAALAAPRV
ncbi:hypothetical protein [Streptomyces sp. 3214.6]|uniref:hypothetical protein n=1 Tax=Streptomyces sp. 3214.6 TaxID=1882757 RepID=UPI00090C06AF|nr:hypothetical protein [Streptomyces sp. 3214.6]SHI06014.1 hypothetical protein SAMN05444521_3590 [Streptomyces sp. 3214.6]